MGGDAEPSQDVAHVPIDRPLAEDEPGGDLLVRLPGRDQAKHPDPQRARLIGPRQGLERVAPGASANVLPSPLEVPVRLHAVVSPRVGRRSTRVRAMSFP